ncbi:unnamed protein product [Adineta steineri]|uniref:Uncharacterized protein n=1 Tax=Adineta steineri TaxID=433720 RepID=A0A819S709_9BILA|nr:unnamed protein product [Adineta steineri]CAF4058549.1 unnamed protein product [Adineta steineri]
MSFTNWRGMILGASLIWLSPITITVIIYACTLNYMRHHSPTFTLLQQTRIKLGMPACASTIVYYLFDYIGWWANHLTWLTCILSFIGLSIVQTCFSPHLRVLWSKNPTRFNPTRIATLRNFT